MIFFLLFFLNALRTLWSSGISCYWFSIGPGEMSTIYPYDVLFLVYISCYKLRWVLINFCTEGSLRNISPAKQRASNGIFEAFKLNQCIHTSFLHSFRSIAILFVVPWFSNLVANCLLLWEISSKQYDPHMTFLP